MQFLSKSLPPEELPDFEAALNQFPPRCVRLRPDRISETLPFDTFTLPWNTRARLLSDSNIRPSQFLQYAGGDYYIQEAGSLLAVTLAQTKPDDIVCDLCAAPGGKASAMLEDITGNGLLVANEVIGSRVAVLKYNLSRTGNPRYVVTNRDSSDLSTQLRECFDLIMVDAPCSGQTLTIKNKRGDNAFDVRHVEHAAARQNRILDDAFAMLKVGGRLVYSTCTFADQENEAQLQRLLELYPNAVQMSPMDGLAEYGSPLLEGCYRLWPHRHPTAGSFAARIVKVDSIDSSVSRSSKRASKTSSKSRKQTSSSTPESMLSPFGSMPHEVLLSYNEDVHGIYAASYERARNLFESGVLPISGLPKLLSSNKNAVVPNHELALMSGQDFIAINTLELGDHAARLVASGAALEKSSGGPMDLSTTSEGVQASKYSLACWQGRPLGWIKSAGNRWNNLIPPVARLSIGGHP